MIDNSYCGPLYQQPIELGIDLSAQTATKYIGGHSDVVAGVVTGSKELIKKIFDHEFMNIGASAFAAFGLAADTRLAHFAFAHAAQF